MKKITFILLFAPLTICAQVKEEPEVIEEVEVFIPEEQMIQTEPEFPGGQEAMFTYLRNHVEYPSEAMKKGEEGVVYVSFTIAKDGTVEKIKVIKGVSASLDQEAIRVISKMPKWKPGTQNGKAVPVQNTMPIQFRN